MPIEQEIAIGIDSDILKDSSGYERSKFRPLADNRNGIQKQFFQSIIRKRRVLLIYRSKALVIICNCSVSSSRNLSQNEREEKIYRFEQGYLRLPDLPWTIHLNMNCRYKCKPVFYC